EAIAGLRDLIDKGHISVRICADLGWALFEERRYAEAAQYLDLARGLPNAEAIAATLADGAEKARARQAETPEETASQSVDRALNRIRSHAVLLRWTSAEREADQLLALAPEQAEAHYWRGYLHHIFGERTQAERHYEAAVAIGSEEARAMLELIRLEAILANEQPTELPEPELHEPRLPDQDAAVSAINPTNLQSTAEASTTDADPNSMATHVRLAKLLDEHGWSGRAVAVLEAARTRFGDKPEILVPLADLYRKFARPEDAAPLYRLALKEWPHEKTIREGLSAAEAALREPKF
ncbi:MAG: tetratricopeptide repeat protein, partial [Candidatus Saccharimonas sp.]|nr:tetratricopeptide repeat protein [Planctomycetaceae bacterium]